MLRAAADRITRRRASTVATVPIPYKGWNTRDPLAEIDPVYAPILQNFYVQDGKARLREGFSQHSTSTGSPIGTLMVHSSAGVNKLFAASGTGFFDVTGGGAPGSAVVTSLSNSSWDWVQFSNLSAQLLVCCNAADGVRTFDGSNWATSTITGATASTLKGVVHHQQRLFFIEDGTLSVWYMDSVNAATGGATEFPLGPLCKKGGELVALGTWTRDSGAGLDDLFVAITSEGEVLVYSGTDPGSNFAKVGTYNIPQPLGGARGVANIGGGLWILTRQGVVSMDDVVTGTPDPPMLTQVIEPTFQAAAESQGGSSGWQMINATVQNWLICNIPVGADGYDQYVLTLRSRAWCRFTGMDATCWAQSGQDLYFGTADGRVMQAFDRSKDDNGASIDADLMFSHYRFGVDDFKVFNGCQVHYVAAVGDITLSANIMTDYRLREPDLKATLVSNGGSPWGSPWGSSWGGVSAKIARLGLGAAGTVGALRFSFLVKGSSLEINGAQVSFTRGLTI